MASATIGSFAFSDEVHYAKRSKKDRLKTDKADGERKFYNICPYMPQHFYRLFICGTTGTGKTKELLNILCGQMPNGQYWNPFDNVILCYKQVQPKYKTLYDSLIEQKCNFFSIDHMPTASEFEVIEESLRNDYAKGFQTVLIFDDLMSSVKKQAEALEDTFTRFSHHYGCSIICIGQSITQLGTRVMRLNTSYFLIKDMAMKTAFADLINQGEDEEYKKIVKHKYAKLIRSNGYNFMIVDNRCNQLGKPWLHYRVNSWFDCYLPFIDKVLPVEEAEAAYKEYFDEH